MEIYSCLHQVFHRIEHPLTITMTTELCIKSWKASIDRQRLKHCKPVVQCYTSQRWHFCMLHIPKITKLANKAFVLNLSEVIEK